MTLLLSPGQTDGPSLSRSPCWPRWNSRSLRITLNVGSTVHYDTKKVYGDLKDQDRIFSADQQPFNLKAAEKRAVIPSKVDRWYPNLKLEEYSSTLSALGKFSQTSQRYANVLRSFASADSTYGCIAAC